MRNQVFSLLFLMVVGVLDSCSRKERLAEFDVTTLDEYFTSQLPADEPGGAILIMKDDSVIFSKGYGISNIKTREPITPQTLFNLGSISKTFVSNAILMLQDQGKLSVNDSLLKYFPNFKNHAIAQKVRIRHLLTHTSGLPDNRQVNKDTVFYLTAKDAENWFPVTQADELGFEPGSRFQYSNPAFNALALIVEQVSGMKWQRFVEENIMQPAGMTTTTITDGPHPETGVSHGYVRNHGLWTEDDYGEEPTFPAAGNGGVWSSTEELRKYEIALQNGAFMDWTLVADSRTVKIFPNWTSPDSPHVGWSWFIGQTVTGLKTIGHTGSQGGFLCNYVTIPDKKIFFVILCNTPRNVDGYTEKIVEWLAENKWLE